MIKVAIIGGSGYAGGELVRLLLFHPEVTLVGVTSQSHAGKKVSDIHKNLLNITAMKFQKENVKSLSKISDVLFFALPHGVSMEKIKDVDLTKTKVIDLGADFRLKNDTLFEKVYGVKHAGSKLLESAVYGLPEWHKDEIKKATLVACPGCFPTGALLAILPLVKAGMVLDSIIIDSKTGSSGSGVKPSESTHHPERAQDVSAYNVFSHRHYWEMTQEINNFEGKSDDLIFTAHSVPIVRGIFTTAYMTLKKPISKAGVLKIYEDAYQGQPFVRLTDSVHCSVVAGTNYCDISVYAQGNKVIVTSAIDNLVKGAAGQAIQNMNIMFGQNEKSGLTFPGMHP